MQPAIRVENISKLYQIGGHAGYRTLRESIVDALAAPFRRAATPNTTDHWALRDVSFEVKPGEVVGIIGRNGAGKSTLLKVLSRITEPTSGRAKLRGRVVSLLEVGTGFHHELTGRENIYLNGAILGMTRREIDRKFDAIVAFSEIEKFIDTPAKRYSSGMYVRLAFAVAAHLDPEILVVDEVLAVGDAAFQKKCLDRIRQLGQSGGTILFVSHSMGTVASLCHSAIVLDRGVMTSYGPAREQVRNYITGLSERTTIDVAARTDRSGNGAVRVVSVNFLDGEGRSVENVLTGEPLTIRFGYQAQHPVGSLDVQGWVCNEQGMNLTTVANRFTGDAVEAVPVRGYLDCVIPEVNFAPGSYLINVTLSCGGCEADSLAGAARLDVEPGPFFPTGRVPAAHNGIVLTRHHWRLTSAEQNHRS